MSDIRELFDAMPDTAAVEPFDNEAYIGIAVQWTEKGRGFGSYDFFVNKETGKFQIDNECDPRAAIKKVLDFLLDNELEEVRKFLHAMADMGELKDKKSISGKELK